MNSFSAEAGTLFSKASTSQAFHIAVSANMSRAAWDSVHGL
jgi:hypothetical protein